MLLLLLFFLWFSERFEYDDDDDDGDDDYNDFNSGSGDYNTNQYGGAVQNWRSTTIDESKLKRLIFKHESSVDVEDSINANVDDERDDNDDDGDDDDDNDSIEQDADSSQQQKISAKIAYAHKKLMQKTPTKNQKSMRKPKSKSKSSNANKKDQTNASNYVDWSGSDETTDGRSAEQKLTGKNDWIEPRIRRILDNIKRSEERSQQILLCKGEGELCNMLFKRPNQPTEP